MDARADVVSRAREGKQSAQHLAERIYYIVNI